MPVQSKRVSSILQAGKSGWEVHFEALKAKRAGVDIIMLSIGDHDFPSPAETVDACIEALRAGHHHYTDLPGLPALRHAMANATARSTGVATSADQVIATAGGQGALFAAIQATVDPGDHAIVVGPYYATYPGSFRIAGGSFSVANTRAEDDFEPNPAMLEAALQSRTKALLINSPNNPTGAVYSQQTVAMISQFCMRHDLWLISDEVYWTHVGGGTQHFSPLALPGMQERTLVINSVSKSHGMTGWRVGWLRGPEPLIKTMMSINLVVTYGLSDFVSRAAAAALEGDWGVAEITARYTARRQLFTSAFDGSNGVVVRGSKGGMYAMLDVRAVEADGEKFAFELLRAEGVAVMPGESFGVAAAGHVRVSLVQSEAVLGQAVLRIKRFIDTLATNT